MLTEITWIIVLAIGLLCLHLWMEAGFPRERDDDDS